MGGRRRAGVRGGGVTSHANPNPYPSSSPAANPSPIVLALTVTLTLTSCGARVKAPPIALRSTEVVLRHLVIVGLG